jgi:polyhydroxybutyrate depolymerase
MLPRPLMRHALSSLVLSLACGDAGGGSGDGGSSTTQAGVTMSTGASGNTGASTAAATSMSSDASTASDDASSDGGTTETTTTGGEPEPSDGCGLPAEVGAVTRMIEVAGQMRTFTVSIPDAYDPEVPHPVAFGFHGLGGSGSGYYIPGGLDPAPIVVGPDAAPAGGAWNTTGDLEFVDAILATLSSELCLDHARVFASGYSNGGFMADAVACSRADVFRGVAIMEGGSAGGFGCGQTAVWIMHNQDDMTVPISYGDTLHAQWIAANGCAETTQAIAPSPCVVHDGCSAGNPVVWCSPATGGHNPNYDAAAAVPAWWNGL